MPVKENAADGDMMTDERHNLPSASSFEIVACCPGQPQLKATLPKDLVDVPDEDAQMGLRIHLAREKRDGSGLDESERDIFERGMACEEKVVAAWKLENRIPFAHEHNEIRHWLLWPDGSKATSARIDVHYVADDRIIIAEWKSLWCRSLTSAQRNWQGRVQAVVAAKQHGVKHVRVAFIKAMFGKSDIVDYNEHDLAQAEQAIFNRLWEAQQPDAQRRAGGWCNYCPCKAICPEAQAYSLLPSVIAQNAVEKVQTMPLADVVKLQQSSLIVRKILEAANQRLKQQPKEVLAEYGLTIGDGKTLTNVTDPAGCFAYLESKLGRESAFECVKIVKGSTVDVIAQKLKMSKKEAGIWFDRELELFYEKTTGEGSVEKI